MSICKAIVHEGPRKGNQCTMYLNDTATDEYCGRHMRNKIYDDGISEGHRWCRFFFRGCNNQLDDKPVKIVTCDTCIEKKRVKKPQCQHSGCTDNAQDNEQFCGRHIRDKYRLYEQEHNVKYCDIARGCFTLCEEGFASCKECLAKERELDNERHAKNIALNAALVKIAATDSRICSKCSNEFESFKTTHNKESTKCRRCFDTQSNAEQTRSKRERNYKAEKYNNLEYAYKEYIKNATKRNLEILITFDEFTALVTSKCYYCEYSKKGETTGIDRINNDIGYILSNCVPCCETCNRMKLYYHPEFFVEKCKIITKQQEVSQEFYSKWAIYYTRSVHNNYTTYKRLSEVDRKIPFHLTEHEWDVITRNPCYLCGYQTPKGIGIDRVDNTIREYTKENCKPCCGSCNSMKSDMNFTDFIKHMLIVSTKWIDTSTLKIIAMFSNPYKSNVIIDTETNTIINPPKKVRTKWFAKSLYNAILSNTENDFVEFNKDVVTNGEMTKISKEIRDNNNKETSLERLSKYINTVRVRRARNINTVPETTS